MTTLAVRGSRFHNGVSRIHGDVSARMLHYLWPQIQADENPVTYVTNAVHVPTYLSPDWYSDFDRFLGFGWTERPGDSALWARVEELPDYLIWSRHQFLKSQMLALVRQRITVQHDRNRRSQSHLDRMLRLADPANPNVLTIGFGRRFATYKRATLLLDDLERLKRIIGDPQRPVLFIFAGKAHPADVPGQELIRELARISRMPEFEGRILLVEGYDLRLARRLVCGVDVWLNNPIYPLEASGTSGMKAGINGVLNLSVLDGWWDEGYTGDNGWAIKPASDALEQSKRDHEEAGTLYEILQDQVLPQYYRRGEMGYSPEWTRRMKRSISTILPHFNTSRMLGDYVRKFYEPAARQGRLYARDSFETARAVAAWKRRVREAWPGVRAQRLDPPARRLPFGTALRVEVAVALNGLDPADVRVEVPAFKADASDGPSACYPLKCTGTDPATGEFRYLAEFVPDSCGRYDYRIRVYPYRDALTHRFETGLMIWV
jgi:starch phosphorylase